MNKPLMYDRHGNLIDSEDDTVLRDGQRVRVPMMLMDGMQREIAERAAATGLTDATREVVAHNLAAGQRQVAAMADHAAGVQRHLDELRGEARARQALADRDPRQAAYNASCEAIDYRGRAAREAA